MFLDEQYAAKIRSLERRVARLETLETGCLVLVEHIDFGGSFVLFDNIPQSYKHLWLWIHADADNDLGLTLRMTFNGDSGAFYDWERQENTTIYSGSNDNYIALGGTTGAEWVAHEVNIMEYTGGVHKRVIWKGARTAGAPPCVDCTIIQGGALYEQSEAIESITITSTADEFGDIMFSLYALC